jgi:hypothetical protein
MGKMDFSSALTRELDHYQTQYGLKPDKAFLLWFATAILELNEDEALEAISVEGANDKGIDLFYVDDEEGRIFIVQGKYSPSLAHSPKEKDVSSLESSLNWLSNPEALEREGKKELAQAGRDYDEARKNGYGVELIFVYAGKKSENIEKKIEVYNQNSENIEKNRVFRHYHLELIQSLWEENQGGRQRIEKATLKPVGETLTIDGSFGKAILATVACSEIVRLYNLHHDRLFDRNVRLFLGARKGSVNAGIANTIKDPNDRGNFWAYNNGITIICDTVYLEKSGDITIINFSIVNGCQTTVSLAENEGDSPELMVLVRCIAASASIVDDVIRYTNSQNPIRSWDIASQDRTQRRLKTEFDHLKKPYIYITRRGDKPAGNLKKYRDSAGKLRQISIDIAGQYMAAFRCDPVLAYKHKAFIFSRYHDEVFPPDIRVEEVLFACTCGEICRPIIAAMIKSDPEAAKILKKGGILFTLAVMSEVIRIRNGATYISTITEEQADGSRMKDRLKKYAQYSAMKYLEAVNDEASLKSEELATLIRQRDFFGSVLNRVKREYQIDALNPQWLNGALPKLGKHE